MKKQILILLLLFVGTMNVFSQLRTVGSYSERNAEYKKAIGLDTTVPDFDTNKIDAKVMGSRLANILNYLLENYNQGSYELQITQILGEQNESLQHLYYKIKKMQFVNASKQGDVLTVLMHVWPDKNQADVNQADMMFRFVDGVSDDQTTNALFSYMSRYVESQEAFYQQEGGILEDSKAIVTNSFWDNWYGQVGLDMHLQFPEGHNIGDVFPKGVSYGVDVAVGKWFTPVYGGRFKIKWNNGILKNNHNTWLHPYGVPGGNYDQGGFMTFIWDIQFNLHNLFGKYNPDRKWNLIVSPRAGGWLDNGSGKGCPILGLGFVNTYRLSKRLSLFADISYNFVASINGVDSGTGHSSNGFAEVCVGIEMDLSKTNTFHRISGYSKNKEKNCSVISNSIWDNWFAQIGLGISLQNPYGTNFLYVFPNGNTYGANLAIGKWFSPDAGIRVGLNWQNGIIKNDHASYLKPREDSMGDPDKSSFISLYGDFILNFTNIIRGYERYKKWNTLAFARMGLARNFQSEYKENPILGIGVGQTYAISARSKMFFDLAYQVTTSGFHDKKFHTGFDNLSSNGWFDINIGIQYELGQTIGWKKLGDKRPFVVYATGHNWPRFIVNTGASVIVAFGVKSVLKKAIKEERPDHSDNKSFPSGHASIAFAAARSLDKEFRKDCIWIPIAGYAAATAIGVERVVNDRHHWYDVVAGAGIGFGAAELTWWLSDLMFGKGRNIAVGSSGNTLDVTYSF